MTYVIPAQTLCSIAKDDDQRQYHAWTTTKELRFDRYRTFESGAMTFERDGWILLIKADKVRRDSGTSRR